MVSTRMWAAPALTPQQQQEARERRDTQRVGQKLQRGHGDDFPLIEEGSRMTAVTRTERQDRDRQRSNTSSAASGAATAGGYPRIPVLAPGEVVFRDPRVSRYSKNSSIVTKNVGDFLLSVASMVCLLSRKYLLVSGRTMSSRIKLISNSYSRFLKNGEMPGCPGQGLAEEGRARLARSILTIICTFLGKPPVRPRRAGNLSRSRSFDAAHVLGLHKGSCDKTQ